MTRIRILVTGVLAMLALMALTPPSSSALLAEPQVGRCLKVPPGTGEYELASCTGGPKLGGSYHWEPSLVKSGFTTTGGLTVLETVGKTRIECTKFIGVGDYGLPDDENMGFIFQGCKDVALSYECTNAGPEEVVTPFFVAGELVFLHNFINKEGKLVVSVGLALGETSVNFECGPNKYHEQFIPTLIMRLSPIDKMTKTQSLKFVASGGKQNPSHFEGGGKYVPSLQQTLPLMPKEEAGLSSIGEATNEELVEIKAKE